MAINVNIKANSKDNTRNQKNYKYNTLINIIIYNLISIRYRQFPSYCGVFEVHYKCLEKLVTR